MVEATPPGAGNDHRKCKQHLLGMPSTVVKGMFGSLLEGLFRIFPTMFGHSL
jgi:hypothetical protein